MGKRIYWILLILISLAGLTTMIYFGRQPRSVVVMPLSKFESPSTFANSIRTQFAQELKSTPVILFGIEFDHEDQLQVWQNFLSNIPESEIRFDEIFVDKSLPADIFLNSKVLNFKDDFQEALSEIESALAKNHRVALLVPTSFSAQSIPGNLTFYLNSNLSTKAISLSLVDLPRSREQEKNMAFPCVVEGVDQSGLGPFGCLLVQSARSQYRKRYSPGEYIAFVKQISADDYILFYTQEK